MLFNRGFAELGQEREVANYLKGLVILTVIFAHYSQYFLTDHYQIWFVGLAQSLLVLFFILSGYGIYLSLEKRLGDKKRSAPALAGFFLSRALRIYPFYWLALFATPYFDPDYYAVLHEFSLKTVAIYMAVPFVKATGEFWFITSIVQCYLVAPLLYFLLKRTGLQKYILINIVAMVFLLAASVIKLQTDFLVEDLRAYLFKGFLLSHVLAFSLGMTLPPLMVTYRREIMKVSITWVTFPVFAIFVILTSGVDLLFRNSTVFLFPMLLFSGLCMIVFSIANRPRLPFTRYLVIPGKYSYPAYLFHLPFFGVLAYFGLIKNEDWKSPLLLIALLPLFMVGCIVAQNALDFIRRGFIRFFPA